jgi:hypothetical protein
MVTAVTTQQVISASYTCSTFIIYIYPGSLLFWKLRHCQFFHYLHLIWSLDKYGTKFYIVKEEQILFFLFICLRSVSFFFLYISLFLILLKIN